MPTFDFALARKLWGNFNADHDIQRVPYYDVPTDHDLLRLVRIDGSISTDFDLKGHVRVAPPYVHISNVNSPLTYPDGSFVQGTKLTFTLCDSNGRQIWAVDEATGDMVVSRVVTYTDDYGEFGVQLWPNTRVKEPTYYKVELDVPLFDYYLIWINEDYSELEFGMLTRFGMNQYGASTSRQLKFSMDVVKPYIYGDSTISFGLQPEFNVANVLACTLSPRITSNSEISVNLTPAFSSDTSIPTYLQPRVISSNDVPFNVEVP